MAGEDQYIHPIIQAILGAQQLMQQKQELGLRQQQVASQTKAQQSEAQYRQGLLDEAQTRLQQEHDYQMKLLDSQNMIREAQVQASHANSIRSMQELLNGGIPIDTIAKLMGGTVFGQPAMQNTPGIIGGTPDTRQITLPGMQQPVNVSDFMTPEQSAQREMNIARGMAGAKAGGAAEAEQPFRLEQIGAEQAGQQALEKQRESFEGNWKQANLDYEKQRDQLDNNTRLRIAGMTTGAEMKRAEMEYGITPNEMQAGIVGMATGSLPISASDLTNPRAAQTYSAFVNNGGRPPSKDDVTLMASYGRLQDLWNKFDDFTKELPSEKDLGVARAVGNAYLMNQVANSKLTTNIKNQRNLLATQIYSEMQNIQGFTGKRLNTNDMNLLQNGLTNIGTQETAKTFKQGLMASSDNWVTNSLEAGMPTWQQNLLYSQRKIPPAWYLQEVNSPQGQAKLQSGYTPDIDLSLQKSPPGAPPFVVWKPPAGGGNQ